MLDKPIVLSTLSWVLSEALDGLNGSQENRIPIMISSPSYDLTPENLTMQAYGH